MTQATNGNLHRAKKAKNDEFYTQLSDIAKELVYYTKHFKGKTVLCNCDDPMESNFVKFFSLKFEDLGLKRLIATSYVEASGRRRKKPSVLIYEGDKNGNRVPDPEEFTERLIGDGDFRSEECIALLKEADIVVTNPPFSLFREYVAQLVKYKKRFLIIGNMNAITYKEIFSLIKEGKIWMGHTHPKTFVCPDGEEKSFGNICWFTNLDTPKRHEDITLYRKYSRKLYPKYDNYKAIEVSKVADIPMDYSGVMGVPITFLGKHNPEQFEILGATQRNCHDEVPDTRKYDTYWEVKPNGEKTGSSGGKTNENANLVGKDGKNHYFINKQGRIVRSAYQRLFIHNKRLETK